MAKRKKSDKLVASVAAFDDEGRLLFGLRSDMNCWVLPGGHLEEGEDPIKAAVRELYEETGLKPKALKYLGHGVVRRESGNIRVFAFEARVEGEPHGDNDPDKECQTFRFVEVKNKKLPEDIEEHLRDRNNVTLRYLGIHEGEIRKFDWESEEPLGEPLVKAPDDLSQPPPGFTRLPGADTVWAGYDEAKRQEAWNNYRSLLPDRRPDESDVDFMQRSQVPADRAMALKLKGVEEQHLMRAAQDNDREVLDNVLSHSLLTPKVIGHMLQARVSVPRDMKVRAISHPRIQIGPDELEPLVQDYLGDGPMDHLDPEVLQKMLQHPNMAPDQVKRLALHGDDHLFAHAGDQLIKNRPDLPAETLSDIVKEHLAMSQRHEIPAQGSRTQNLLEALKHPNLPQDAIDTVLEVRNTQPPHMGGKPDRVSVPTLEAAVAQNPNLTEGHLTKLIDPSRTSRTTSIPRDGLVNTATMALKHPKLNVEHIDLALKHVEYRVRSAALERHDLVQPRHLERALADTSIMAPFSWEAVAKSPKASPEQLERVHSMVTDENNTIALQQLRSVGKDHASVLGALVQNPAIPPQLLSKVISGIVDKPHILKDAIASPVLNQEHVNQILGAVQGGYQNMQPASANTIVQILAQNRPDMLTPETLKGVARAKGLWVSTAGDVFEAAQNVDPKLLHEIATDPKGEFDEEARAVAMMHPNASVDTARAVISGQAALSDHVKAAAAGHQGLTADDLRGLASTTSNANVLTHIAKHPSADDDLIRRAMAGNASVAEHFLRHGEKVTPEHVAWGLQHPEARVQAAAVAHAHTTPDQTREMLWRPTRYQVDKNSPQMVALNTGRLQEHELQEVIAKHPSASVRSLAKELLAKEAPDSVFKERVGVKVGTGKYRKIRDLIVSKQGRDRMHPKHLPAGDWSHGRGPDGNIHAQKLQEHIDRQPVLNLNVSHAMWDGAQRHDNQHSKVLQFNITSEHVRKMKEAGVYDSFRRMQEASEYSDHPVAKYHGIGWIRYTQGSDPVEDCSTCKGEGRYTETYEDHREDCRSCEGSGSVLGESESCENCNDGKDRNGDDCDRCGGTGEVNPEVQCSTCSGSGGFQPEPEEVECPSCDGKGSRGNPGLAPPKLAPAQCQDCGHPETAHPRYDSGGAGGNFAHEHTPYPYKPESCSNCNKHKDQHHPYNGAKGANPFTPAMEPQPDEFFVDEVQSDFGQSFVRQAAAQAQAQGQDPEAAAKRAEEDYPEAHFKAISGILFGGRHPNEILHEAFQQHLRDRGHHAATVHTHTVESKAPISLGKKLKPVCGTCKLPEHEHQAKPAEKDHPFVVHPDGHKTCGHVLHTLNTGAKVFCGANEGAHTADPGANHPYVEGEARLSAPGHFNVTYHDVPKKMGMEPAKYGDLKTTQTNKGMRGSPTWSGKVRKAEGELLAKMALVHDDAANPKTVYRLQNAKGQGPHQNTNILGIDKDPVMEKEWFKSPHHAMPNPSSYGTSKDTRPSPGRDFPAEEAGLIAGGQNKNLLFGFEHPDHAHAWFGTEGMESLKRFGFDLVPTKARKVYRSLSSKQVMYEPHQEPIRKFEDDLSIWLATQPLAKMAIKPSDLKAVAKYHDDEGVKFVDHEHEHLAHPQHHEHLKGLFHKEVVASPHPVRRGKTGTREQSNSTGKSVYDVEDHEGDQHRFMVKPYHEKVVPRVRKWMQHPIQGWAEMTNQSLYHAAQIGDLHQKVHVAEVPMEDHAKPKREAKWHKEFWTPERQKQQMDAYMHGKTGAQYSAIEIAQQYKDFLTRKRAEHAAGNPEPSDTQPALVIHMQPEVSPVRNSRGNFGPEVREQSKKIALMDFLTNNLDRHGDNLLHDHNNNRLLAVDHSRSFQYKTPDKGFWLSGADSRRRTTAPGVQLDDSLHNYLKDSAHSRVDPKAGDMQETPELKELRRQAEDKTGTWMAHEQVRRKAEADHQRQEQYRYNEEWGKVFDWWQTVAPAVKQTMDKRLAGIKDSSVREHVKRNFEARMEHLNGYARDGHDNYGFDDWDKHLVPIYRYGTRDHEG